MRNFIENQQFYYVNDKLKFSGLKDFADRYSINAITEKLKLVASDLIPSIDFLSKSMDDIEDNIEKWYIGYIKKISIINSTSLFIQAKNISTSDDGTYALFEFLEYDNNSMVYDPVADGYTMQSVDEKYTMEI